VYYVKQVEALVVDPFRSPTGQWQAELARRGADIIAYDNGEAVPCPEIPPVGEVHAGDHTELRKHPGRTLLLVYPEVRPSRHRPSSSRNRIYTEVEVNARHAGGAESR
jgi:hypothetical protein